MFYIGYRVLQANMQTSHNKLELCDAFYGLKQGHFSTPFFFHNEQDLMCQRDGTIFHIQHQPFSKLTLTAEQQQGHQWFIFWIILNI